MTSSTERTLALTGALEGLSEALASGSAERVLVCEDALLAALADARQIVAGHGAVVVRRDEIDVARHAMARCRRLGGSVPALLSVMFPGQTGYGPSGAARQPSLPVSTVRQRL